MDGVNVSNTNSHMLRFSLKSSPASTTSARLGKLAIAESKSFDTPHYVAATSRGIVPHIAQNTMRKNTQIKSVYMGLEDFIERSTHEAVPILNTPIGDHLSALSSFTALPEQIISVLGPRRQPPVHSPTHNTGSAISILTSVGFRNLEISDYLAAVHRLAPDIVLAIGDLVTHPNIGRKRAEKSVDRTRAWLRYMLGFRDTHQTSRSTMNLFAQILPYAQEAQALYLQDLSQDYGCVISGLALPSPSSIQAIPESLDHLPRLLMQQVNSPHDILDAIGMGCDLACFPLANTSSDAGLAFTFELGDEQPDTAIGALPLAHDMWSTDYATDLSPLREGCRCYTCIRHHRAYLHHLLQAKEMLAWTLLQIHNHATLDSFFESIRAGIASGRFESVAETFRRRYAAAMPGKTGEGPRVRGYQIKSVGGGEPRKNPKAYGRLDDQIQRLAETEESGVPPPSEDSHGLEKSGFSQKTGSLG